MGPAAWELRMEEGIVQEELKVVKSLRWNVQELTVGSGKKRRAILHDNRGVAPSGSFTALLGPSGSGKTSLLECISLRNRSFKGSVLVDGEPPSSDFFTMAAMVYQQELFFAYMTPREHLTFHATARMSKTRSRDQVMKRIEEVIEATNLKPCADTVIAGTDPLFMGKGISGGERKRLALATELLKCPAIIFLDEPSTGLDSVMAEMVILTLADLAKSGRVVVASLHCPSSDLMLHVTHLMVLTCDGRVAYCGSRQDAVSHFESLGYVYPVDFNPADYMLKIVSRSQRYSAEPEQARINKVVAGFQESKYDAAAGPLKSMDMHLVKGVPHLQSDSWVLFKLNFWRAGLYHKREAKSLVIMGAANVAIGVLFGLLFWQQGSSGWRNVIGLNYSLIVTTLIFASTTMVLVVPLGQAVLHREHSTGVNSPGPFLVAHFLVGWPFWVAPILEATVVYWMTGMPADLIPYLYFCCVMVLTALASLEFGVFVGSLSPHVAICLTILAALETPMIMFSGLLYKRGTVPSYLAWIQYMSIVNCGFSALSIKSAEAMPIDMRQGMLRLLEISPNELKRNLIMLAVLSIAFQVAAYVCLKIRFSSRTWSVL